MPASSVGDDKQSASRNSQDTTTFSPEASPDSEPPSERPVVDERPNYSIFTTWQKRWLVMGAAAAAFFSPLNAQIYFPALDEIASDLGITISQVNLTVTTYMIFQGVTPMFIGSFADAVGRRPAYFICFVIYIAANIGCALAPNYPALLVLRMLQSAGSSTTVALCQAVVADIITSAERGSYVSFVSLPVMIAPALGPVLGGIISQYLNWRWIFWILSIMAGVVFVAYIFFMPETCRNIVGDGSIKPHPVYRTAWQLIKDAKAKASRAKQESNDLQRTTSRASTKPSLHFKRPNILRSLIILADPEMFLLLMYSGVLFAGFYAVATSMATQVAAIYGYDQLKVGLLYLPMAGGSIVAAFMTGRLAQWNYQRHCQRLGVPFERSKQQDMTGFPIERARLEIGLPVLALASVVTIGWGWVLEAKTSVAVPCVMLFFFGISIIGFSNLSQTLLTDVNPGHAGAATASNNLTRCLLGAAATAVIDPMIKGIGNGWSFTIIGALYIVGAPALLLIMAKGVAWRRRRDEKKRLKHERKAAKEAGSTAVGENAVETGDVTESPDAEKSQA